MIRCRNKWSAALVSTHACKKTPSEEYRTAALTVTQSEKIKIIDPESTAVV
jgi:hypothetical protein